MANKFDIETLKSQLAYDAEKGSLQWIVAKRGRRQVVGHKCAVGYLYVRINGRLALGHRIAWALYYGTQPDVVDHINGDKSDNRIKNLRVASDRLNAENIRLPQRNNTSGFLGVIWCKSTGRWLAQITTDRRRQYLGRFDNPENAYAAYLTAKRRLHEGCTL